MKRLFAALKIHPGDDFLKSYRELKQELGHERIKWVEDSNIHITLKFFGETAEQKIPVICSVLKNRAAMTRSFDCQLTGLGIFGSAYAPKVIWVGIAPYAELVNLMKYIHDDLKVAGFEPDRQNLVPHLTLGRIKFLQDKVLFNRTISGYNTLSSSPFPISEMILYESILRRVGPEYIVTEKFPFI